MFYKIISLLKKSNIVSEIEILEFVEEETVNILKVKAKLIDKSLLYITEVHTMNYQKYSYHWQDKEGKTIIRWDNSPHWKEIETFPHHKHIGEQVLPSSRATIKDVLKEIEKIILSDQD